MKKSITIILLLLIISSAVKIAAEQAITGAGSQFPEGAVMRRFGIFIGSNNGGRDRVMLRYAVSDAKSVSRIFTGMGGVSQEDNILLIEPTMDEINRELDRLKALVFRTRQNNQRTELIFYYSGHSDEDGLLLNREFYSYRDLREKISEVQVDMTIVILDSCSSGAITRAKGGIKTQPFLFDTSVSAEGYAFLTSSSADEVSQESDSIESSYFTHSLMAGLRGAADSVGDGRVTLNELYRYAYTETLARTETSLYGTQHPSYDIQISGSGDVVLTDIREISASLVIAENITGRISIRDSSDFLVAELTKITGKPIALGLEPGTYRITLQQNNNFYRTEVRLSENQNVTLSMQNFTLMAADTGNRTRGDNNFTDTDADKTDDSIPVYPVNIQLIPGLDLFGHSGEKAVNNMLLGLFIATGHSIRGVGAASIGLINSGDINGIQAAGIFNIASGYVQGIQNAGILNIAGGNVQGVQGAGIFNMSGGNFQGIQGAGIFNMAGGNFQGIQAAGIFNITGGNVQGIQAAGIFNIAGGNMRGTQIAGITNFAGTLQGIQASLLNVNGGGRGLMAGLVNISGSGSVVPIGLVNVVDGGILHFSIYKDDMFLNAGFRSGSKHFYTHLNFGVGGGIIPWRDGNKLIAARAGFGFEFPIKKAFFDIDFSGGSIIDLDKRKQIAQSWDWSSIKSDPQAYWDSRSESDTVTGQVRLIFGYKFFKHFGLFAGVSYDYLYRHTGSSPDPADHSDFFVGYVHGKHTHKLGILGGIQF